MAVASILLAKPITAVFVSESSHTFAMTVTGFALFGINYLFSGYNVFTSSLFTALSDGKHLHWYPSAEPLSVFWPLY